MPSYTKLRSIEDLAAVTWADVAEANFQAFFQWACLEAGGFTVVAVPTPGTPDPYGEETLTRVHREGVADGTVWQAPRPAWCHETGLERADPPPVADGVYVAGSFYPTATTVGPYAHRIDFPRGLVTFPGMALPAATVVQAAYAYRWLNFVRSDVPWFRAVVLDGWLAEQKQPGAVTAILDDYRISTPVVVVEAVRRRDYRPCELGSRTLWADQDVIFHVLTATRAEQTRACDLIIGQQDASLVLFDPELVRAAGRPELDAYGSPQADGLGYALAVEACPLDTAWISRTSATEQPVNLPLYYASIRLTLHFRVP